jgi:Glutathione synthase/Ribosomal protein S6 modification enzyme (glutaminyl transferase)
MKAALVRVGLFVASIDVEISSENHASDKGCGIKLPEPVFARMLSEAAGRLNMDLFVFSPAGYGARAGQLLGYRLQSGAWTEEYCPLPDIIYDRCFCRNVEERAACKAVLTAIREQKSVLVLNGSLPGKWEVYNALRQDSILAPLLPSTGRLDRPDTLLQLLKSHNKELFLKPSAGMQGRGTLHLRQSLLTGQWIAAGRTRNNLPFRHRFDQYSGLAQWIRRFIGHASYIAQPYLQLTDPEGNPFDLRVLVQKNGQGRWGITGTVIRTGRSGSVTSNLHGGGTAANAAKHLSRMFGAAQTAQIIDKIQHACLHAAERLENSYGRLAELGIDFGIEPDGQIWLLEVNSRPGRSSFQQAGDRSAEQMSVEHPLRYARLLSQRFNKPFISNDSATGRIHSCLSDKRICSDNVQEVHP